MAENPSLFAGEPFAPDPSRAPLAERMRPKSWEDFEGLELLDPNLIARLRSGSGRPPSLILWGPPGTGKTTLARLIGRTFQGHFVPFSAVLGGVKEVREVVEAARYRREATILFVDEIHRFNKAQQDAFLPHVESGLITLIGATTENPSFTLTGALMSRCRLVVLKSLDEDGLRRVLRRSIEALGREFEPGAEPLLVREAAGDARRLLNLVEALAAAIPTDEALTAERIEAYLRDSGARLYDRAGEEHYNTISAFIKSLRGSDPDAALFYGMRMIELGEDPRFVLRRMMIFASEDIGNADPRALMLAVSAADAFDRLGLPEGKIPISQAIVYLATAPKSNRSYHAMLNALGQIKEHPVVTIPLHLRNAPTSMMKNLGYGKEYRYPHGEDGFAAGVRYLPDEVATGDAYEPTARGYERTIAELMRERRVQAEE